MSPRIVRWRATQVVIVPESVATMASSCEQLVQLVRHHLRLHRRVAARAALLHQLVPLLHAVLRLLEEAAVLAHVELRQQRVAARARVSPTRPASTG